mmetsp:Transcript_11379/g.17173  ORF Transcript_11379/g.17173 Transcript_11379/m.17173 type:complete len:97 (+) Transcript_11379:436-726(+)
MHIRTRCVKSIRSHAQKFLIKLVKFIGLKFDKGKPLDMTLEEAEYFHGILTQKHERLAFIKSKEEEEVEKLREQGAIFRVTKIHRRKRGGRRLSQK